MFRIIASILMAILFIASTGCSEESRVEAPAAMEMDGSEIGYFCNMIVMAHSGPKGQIFLSDQEKPLWFSSVRDTIAFTKLPGEPKNISAIYVSDIGKADWNQPEPGTWVDGTKAWYVIGSGLAGGMGAPETVPFSEKQKAEAFVANHGGQIVTFEEIPRDEVIGFSGPDPESSQHNPDTH